MKLSLLFLFVLFGQPEALTTLPLDHLERYDLYIDDELELNGYTLRFAKVIDSRCPKDVICNRAGEAKVFLDIYQSDRFIETKVVVVYPNASLSSQLQTELEINGFGIKILDVLPYPMASKPTKSSDVVLRIEIWEL